MTSNLHRKFTEFFLSQLDELNNDPNVHGIIVQMPLDCANKIDSDVVTDYVSDEKDVDGQVNFNVDLRTILIDEFSLCRN